MESRGALAPAFLLVLFRRMFWVERLVSCFPLNDADANQKERQNKASEYRLRNANIAVKFSLLDDIGKQGHSNK